MSGRFIVLCGPDGVGKDTIIDLLKSEFSEIVFTREPGGTKVGEEIRETLLKPDNHMDGITELLLYSAGRRENIEKIVKPAIADGKTVIASRYYEATYIYQHKIRNVDFDTFKNITQAAVSDFIPDLVISFYVSDSETLIKRLAKRQQLDRLDKDFAEHVTFVNDFHSPHKAMYNVFQNISGKSPIEVYINADDTIANVYTAVKQAILSHKR